MTSFIWKQKQQQNAFLTLFATTLFSSRLKQKTGPVAWYLALKVCVSVAGSSSIRVTWDFLGLAGSYPGLGVLWAQWGGGTTQPSFIHLAAESLRALL